MSKFCIRVGECNKKLLIPFLLALIQIISNIFNLFYPEDKKNPILESYSIGIGQALIIIIPHIKFFSLSNKGQNEDEKNKSKCSKKNFLHYFILILLFAIKNLVSYFCSALDENKNKQLSIIILYSETLSVKEGIEIIFVTIGCIILLKYKYFIHHYLSIFFFLALSIGIDFLLDNYTPLADKKFLEIFMNILSILTKVAYFCYIKYMIDRQYHQYWNIMFILGMTLILINSIAVIAFIIIPKEGAGSYIMNFHNYFKDVPIGIIISKFLINTIIQFIYNILEILTLFYLSPEYILIAQNSAKIIIILMDENDYKYIGIVFFLVQFFSLMIYLEIFELDFLYLNKNTKRSIRSRMKNEFADRKDTLAECDFEYKGYAVNYIGSRKKDDDNLKVELKEFLINDDSDKGLTF